MEKVQRSELVEEVVELRARVAQLESERDSLARSLINKAGGENRVEQMLVEKSQELLDANERLKKNQTQMVHSEKMAGLGQLAAGIAHEINNPVGFMTSNLNTLRDYCATFKELLGVCEKIVDEVRESPDKERFQTLLDEIEQIKEREDLDYILDDVDDVLAESLDGATRVRDIVVNLRNFARLDEADLKEADINEGIEQTLRVAWNELKYRCEVVKEFGEVPVIPCYPGQLNQVFLNLLVNAAHAIKDDHGTIRIRTGVEGDEIVVRISDTGVGIAPENLNRLFDPFFTTKPVGEGTGLGLSIAHGIVENHNGRITVESEVGVGTTFTIRIPAEGVRHA